MKITIDLKINNKQIKAEKGKTILQIAKENSIEIPALCNCDSYGELGIFGSCGICTVEIEGSPKLFRACSTIATEGMLVHTDTERVRRNRKTALELMLSDHEGDCKPPCALACPADTDCMGYVKLISEGKLSEAVTLIREKVPFPASIGRICPRPCEDACRRQLIEEPIAIASLKQFAGDRSASDGIPHSADLASDKSVAVIGGGPAGLSAAYYLRLKGHAVTIHEAMPYMGGMLRYGVPEFRLPNDVLQKEIDLIENTGIKFINNSKTKLSDLYNKYDAVIVAIGAWNSVRLGIDGEIGGIDYLGKLGGSPLSVKGKTVAVIGGGNTAMDACRVAVREGAKSVHCVYRRTREEMPANPVEVNEAEEEGVRFMFSTTPDKLPEGFADVTISAIGQRSCLDGFSEIETTEYGTIIADRDTFCTNIENVFAIGDVTNQGTDIAVRAIGEGRKCAQSVDGFLNGTKTAFTPTYLAKSEKTAEDFAGYEKKARANILTEETAKKEASRCLECGCGAYSDKRCKLLWYANQYGVQPERLSGDKHDHKCILCGLCVRVCENVEKKTMLDFTKRGFDTTIEFFGDLSYCKNCGKCFDVCPTGEMYKYKI
jgi:formate dehydrogenase major subunit